MSNECNKNEGYIVCDQNACVGCLACVVACIDRHYPETCADAVSGRIYEKHTSARTGMTCYVTRSCLHCQNPACVTACPTGALFPDGLAVTDRIIGLDQDKCIGCQACASACPHDMIRFDGSGRAMKCDGCADRIAQGLPPLCVKICPVGALSIRK